MEKIKLFLMSQKGKDILTILIVILVGLSSFGLGRLSKQGTEAGINIEYPLAVQNQDANAISSFQTYPASQKSTNSSGKSFFASNRGSKYYSLGCSGGKTIKQENRVYFATSAEAEQAGYDLSVSCK